MCVDSMVEAFRAVSLSLLLPLLALSTLLSPSLASAVHVITNDNFDDVSTGEWMLEL